MLHTNKTDQTKIWVLVVAIFALVLVRTAWISDDAAITLRTVLNFINGYGPTFNIDERVQAYTHPLWFIMISAVSLATKNVFAATLILSFALSLLTVWILVDRIADSVWWGLVAAIILLFSKAFVDFSTSGLENPLSHLLIAVFVYLAIISESPETKSDQTRPLMLFVTGIAYLSRPDLLVLLAPTAVLILTKISTVKTKLRSIIVASAPVIFWTLFSLIYYGFPFPNTAYAKLGTGISLSERAVQGGRYLLDSIFTDPITLPVITVGLFIGLIRKGLISRSLALGIALYVLYVVSIGGDFMSGRFLTAPLLVSVIIIARTQIQDKIVRALSATGIFILGLSNAHATILSSSSYSNTKINSWGIADERGFYFQRFGLIPAPTGTFVQPNWHESDERVIAICGMLGFTGIALGPSAHLIDVCGLADPLLARLPAKYEKNWRIGHFDRQLPTDYEESIAKGENLLTDLATRNYYEAIRNVTRGPIFSFSRIRDIYRLNFGLVEDPSLSLYRDGLVPRISSAGIYPLTELEKHALEGKTSNAPGNIVFETSLEIAMPGKKEIKALDISLDDNDTYRIEFLLSNAGTYFPITELGPKSSPTGMAHYSLSFDPPTHPINRIRVTAVRGDGMYSIGHLHVTE